MVKCGWASIDENGRAKNGKAGDQTGKEVKTGDWYQFGQTAVYRWKNRTYATKYASIIKAWCGNKNIGYDQNQRTTLGQWCKSHKWAYDVGTPVETDCSRMVADAINCTIKREVIPLNSTFYTGNLGEVLTKTGLFEKLTGSKYCNSSDYLMVGDIINNPARHVISALANGAKIVSGSTTKTKTIDQVAKEVIDGKWGDGETRKKKLRAAGYDPDAVQKKVNALIASKRKKSNTTVAKEVIDGKWGTGAERKKRLTAAGYNYTAIQKLVNQMVK